MLFIAVVCMLGATIVLSVLDCFLKKNKAISLSLQLLTLASLFSGTIALAQYKNKLSLFSILLAISVLPQILTLFNFKYIKKSKKQQNLDKNLENIDKKTSFFEKLDHSNGKLIQSLGILLTSIVLSVCGLILGLETIYLYILAVAIATFLTFVTLVIKKNINLFNLVSYIFAYLAISLALTQILTILVYSYDLKNILYCFGMLLYAIYSVCLIIFKRFSYSNLIYLMSMAVLLTTFII